VKHEDLRGTWAMERSVQWPSTKRDERTELALEYGLESAASIRDRKIPLFNRSGGGFSNSGRMLGAPFLEDMRELGGQDVAFIGVPLDTGTTYRSGTRFGPEAMRRISSLGSSYNPEIGVDLVETLDCVDVGDVSVIPANIEKSFDQIARAIGYLTERSVFPVVLGGDHSIGYPDVMGMSPYIDGNIGIIHFDRHSDLSEFNMDERMHGTPFFHATNIPNAPPQNLVQIGIGGWTGSRDGMRIARDRRATVITLEDVDQFGIDKIAEYALEIAWRNAKAVFISFDIDCMDPAFAPGTGTPEPGGFLPRELLKMIRKISREGISGLEVVEVAPPYDVADITSLLGVRVIQSVLAEVVLSGQIGKMPELKPPDGGESNLQERV
jgi:agmatinase